jgi:hypothetical protein
LQNSFYAKNRKTTQASVSFSSLKEEKAGMRSLRAQGETSFDVRCSAFDVRCSMFDVPTFTKRSSTPFRI